MHMTKHAFGVYSTSPGPVPTSCSTDVQARLDARPTRSIRDVATGEATVAAYTVAHARDGSADWGLAVCDLDDGARCYARMEDAELLNAAETTEMVGERVELVPGEKNVNLVKR
jgi:acetyl-CoA C-acetyltransferase